MLRTEDISLAQEVLKILDEEELILISQIQEQASGEAQVERVISSLCKYRAAERGKISLDKTSQTAVVIVEGGAEYIYNQEQKDQLRVIQQDKDLQLAIDEKKRNKYYSTVALIVSLLSLIISAAAFIISL